VEPPTGTRLESATKKGVRIGNMLSDLEDSGRDEEYKEKKNELHAHGRLALRADTAAGKALADAMEVVKQCEEKKKETAKALESAKVTIGAAQGCVAHHPARDTCARSPARPCARLARPCASVVGHNPLHPPSDICLAALLPA
jgi:cysteinyl-tRNA synthetase